MPTGLEPFFVSFLEGMLFVGHILTRGGLDKLATVVEGDQKAPFFNSYYSKV